jgi:hypothetical protein
MLAHGLLTLLVLFIVGHLTNAAFVPAYSYEFSHVDDMMALTQLRDDIHALNKHPKVCQPVEFGKGYGSHKLCNHFPGSSMECYFLSFGIERDFSFDKMLHEKRNCTGLGLDPTTDYPSELTPGVAFLKAGANSPRNWRYPEWDYWGVPTLRIKKFDHPLFALKMDCEGCEYSLAHDIIRDNPNFFATVLQFNFEVHLPRAFAPTDQNIYDLGRLFRLIYLSGMKLVHYDNGLCGPKQIATGCHQLLHGINFPCNPSCRSYLFSHDFKSYEEWKTLMDSVNISYK